jgi:hypothetical protein
VSSMTAPEPEQSAPAATRAPSRSRLRADRFRLLQLSLLVLRSGPALILLVLIAVVSSTTPVFRTSGNIGTSSRKSTWRRSSSRVTRSGSCRAFRASPRSTTG